MPYSSVKYLMGNLSANIIVFLFAFATVSRASLSIALSLAEIEEIVSGNPDNIVVIDEAYVDFGNQSAVSLVDRYDNLLVTGTFSKSRSMAGARLGFGVASKEIIQDLNTIKYSTNPYNINRMTMAAGIGALDDEEYTKENCSIICENREYTMTKLKEMGFVMTPSTANFIFAKHPSVLGIDIYTKLREKGILVRHFTGERICEYNRITVGTKEQMDKLLTAVSEILEDK